jgi:hypothetical protein
LLDVATGRHEQRRNTHPHYGCRYPHLPHRGIENRTTPGLGHEDICRFRAESISGSKRRDEQQKKKRKPAPVESFAK